MFALDHVDVTPLSQPHSDCQSGAGREDPSAMLAQHIVQRALQNLAYLDQVPAHIRAHRDWFRDAVIIPIIESISVPDGQQATDIKNTIPSCEPFTGAPITDNDPAHVRSFPLMNGNTRSGTCDVCDADGLLTFKATLAIHHTIETLQMHTCARCEEQLAGNGPQLTQKLYEKGHFH